MKKIKLQEWALVAEIVGAVAVVISLIYVGVSVRQNTDAIMVSNHQSIVAMDIERNTWYRDLEFAALYELALQDYEQLSPPQLRQFRTFVADTFNTWEYGFITHSRGMMDDTIWDGWDQYYRSELTKVSYQWFWNSSKMGFSDEFRAYVDSIQVER
ncbi:MAG: hypothetical protein R3F41_08850 [Gammaproteobacteria bacterium]|nr:hypothetical protein [Pseudomonadales bacterium]